jgi:hypothetical protein
MPVGSSSQPSGLSCVSEALAEIRACSDELQTFVSGVFDHLDGLTDQLRKCEFAREQSQQQADRETVQGEIDRLSAVAAQLAEMMAEQKQLAGRKPRNQQPES